MKRKIQKKSGGNKNPNIEKTPTKKKGPGTSPSASGTKRKAPGIDEFVPGGEKKM